MRMILCVLLSLCVLGMAVYSETAGAQQAVSNFDACVNQSKLQHTDSVMENYLSYKCDGDIAEKLAARPDQCARDVKPSLRRIVRRSKQLADGLYQRMIWSTAVCAGMCETMTYGDARKASYLCEVRRHTAGRMTANNGQTIYRRYVYEYPPRSYDRVDAQDAPRRTWRRVYREPGAHPEYAHPGGDYRDDYRREYDDDRRDYDR